MVPNGTLMVTTKRTLRCLLPIDRQQGVEIVLGRHLGQTAEDVTEVNQGIDAAALTGYHDRVDDRGALPGVGVAHEEPIFLPYCRRPDRVFNQVIVEAGLAALERPVQRLPVFEQGVAGFAHARLRQRLLPEAQGYPLQPVELPGIVLKAMSTTVRSRYFLLVPERLGFVEPSDDEQYQPDRLRVLPLGFKKLPSRMGPAADPRDLRMVPGVALICAVHVALEDALNPLDESRQLPVTARQPPVEDNVLVRPTDHPEPSLGRSPAFFIGVVAAHRRFVGLEVSAPKESFVHPPVNRLQPLGRDPDPVGHRLARDLGTPAGRLPLQPVEGAMPVGGLCRAA